MSSESKHGTTTRKKKTMTDQPKATATSADFFTAAAAIWQMFTALKTQGFTEAQALVIVGTVLQASFAAPATKD